MDSEKAALTPPSLSHVVLVVAVLIGLVAVAVPVGVRRWREALAPIPAVMHAPPAVPFGMPGLCPDPAAHARRAAP